MAAGEMRCQDDPKQLRLEEVVLIPSNSNPDRNSPPIQPLGKKPGFWISNMGCYQWTGTATWQDKDQKSTITATITWQRVGLQRGNPLGGPGGGGQTNRYVGVGLMYAPISG